MATNASRTPQLVSEAAVWAHLAAHLVLAQAEPICSLRLTSAYLMDSLLVLVWV